MNPSPSPSIITAPSSRHTVIVFILVILGAILATVLVYKKTSTQSKSGEILVKTSPIFDSQTATIRGTVTKVNGSAVFINKKGQTYEFLLSPDVAVYKYGTGNANASSSNQSSSVELNREALIVLEATDNNYQIISITYATPAVEKKSEGSTPTPRPKK